MDNLIALLMWLTGKPMNEIPEDRASQEEMLLKGGGIPVKPPVSTAE